MAVIFSYAVGDVAVFVATCLIVAYLYYTYAFKYWKKRGVYYLEPTMLWGNLGTVVLQKEHLAECVKRVYDKNPDQPYIGLYIGKKPFLLVRDLDVVRSILMKDAHAFLDKSVDIAKDDGSLMARSLFFLQGKRWRHMRIKLTPTFTSGKIKKMFYLVNECGKQLLPCINKEMSKGNGILVKETVARYSTDVIASCAFGVNANALADPNCEFRTIMKKLFEMDSIKVLLSVVVVFAPWIFKMFGFQLFEYSLKKFLRTTFWDVVDYRKKNGIIRGDFVDILMQMKEEGQVRAEDANDLEEIKQYSKYVGMEHNQTDFADIKLEDDDFVAQAFIFIAAGFETSASVISFTLFELALNPDIQDKLRTEILTVLEKHNSEVTYDAIAEMKYLEMVVSEAMRKYPTLPILDRKCLSDYKIPGSSVIIEKGIAIIIPVLAIHSDPTIYPEPDKFDPERFTPENKSKRSNFAHMPFGEGPRMCIGMRFGQMQVKTALVHILTTFNVKPCPETPHPPLGIKPGGAVNIPRKDIILAFEKFK